MHRTPRSTGTSLRTDGMTLELSPMERPSLPPMFTLFSIAPLAVSLAAAPKIRSLRDPRRGE